ncbi:hypothetical protein L0666_02580 [Octadecabacter sp. CECT 8868]|uniref:hypothetical protein n=1 Tax=Octadecabacter algicola TaxID=2909342 RepID=UPI001F39787B|nr:hypothetical protein [Octadecabacter algicola]MCF2903861.1 hypothetical protein [Octadecabacter algicola]
MSQLDHTQREQQRFGADKIILGVLAAMIVGALLYVSSQQQQRLRSSPTGLDGLQIWLSSDDQTVRSFTGGWPLNADDIGLLMLPFYDTDLANLRTLPRSEEELIAQQDEYDLRLGPILAKINEVPTLIILPKWRSGMRLTGLAHPILLINRTRVEDTLNDLPFEGGAHLDYAPKAFSEFTFETGSQSARTAVIYSAQTFAAQGCAPIVGTHSAMILGSCALMNGTKVFVLSDPDLINNHGLLQGDNAFIIRDFVAQTVGTQQVIIDYSRDDWLTRDSEGLQRERTWADLKRFFSPPFTLMWAGLLIAVVLILWRAALRFGPLLPTKDRLGASKMKAIGARARLMRLAGRDGALVVEYSKARLAATASELVGAAHGNQISKPEAFLAYAQRRHPRYAMALTEALNTISSLPQNASAAQAMAAAASLDTILEHITHDT